ncbi:MAG TPA: VWA domain-containing protein [Blastocatellia bacterium]|nr:VWA domain-containing protein [Blastocatellia bacterium]
MKSIALIRATIIAALLAVLLIASAVPRSSVLAQSGRQPEKKKVEKKTDEKRNEDKKAGDPQDPMPPLPKDFKQEPPIKLSTQVVNVEVTVIDKKSGRLYTNLSKNNFTIYEDGVKQETTNFSSGEGPMTAVLLLENNYRNRRYTSYFDPTFYEEIFMGAATFVHSFVKPVDHIAVVTYSMKPKVIQDFTGDSGLLHQAVMAAARDRLNFSEANIYDSLSFVLLGGKAIQLFEEEAGESQYTGLQEIEGHTAVILITRGIDTFSKLTYDKAMKIVANAGVPIYIVGVGNLFFKKYGDNLPPEMRLEFLQAQNGLNTFAKLSGGAYFPMTFESELPQIMRNISAMLRSQYSLGYSPTNTRREGKERKLKVDIDVDGDGAPDNKQLTVYYREKYTEPDDNPTAKKK